MVMVKAPQHQKTRPDQTFKHYFQMDSTLFPGGFHTISRVESIWNHNFTHILCHLQSGFHMEQIKIYSITTLNLLAVLGKGDIKARGMEKGKGG
jgi:hypothetical protein